MISQQAEEYLETIAVLEERGQAVTTSALASERGVSPPSVTEMLHRLSEQGLLSYEPRGKIALTEQGRAMARSVVRRHRLWERFLHDVLRLGWDRVHQEACKLEHATSPVVEQQLARAIGNNPTCPHGHAIPGPDGRAKDGCGVPLPDLAPSQLARIVSVKEEDAALLRRLGGMGLKPGVVVEVGLPDPGSGQVALKVGEKSYSVPQEVAMEIKVAPVASRDVAGAVPLAELTPGERGVIEELLGGRTFRARVLALGFTPGAPLVMVNNTGSGPIIVLVRDTRVALGRGEAQKIYVVRRTEPDGEHSGS